MKQCLARNDIKKCQAIYYHPNYYLFEGTCFQSCAKNSGLLYSYPEIRTCIRSITFLPNNRLLVDDSRNTFHLLDLSEGRVILSRKVVNERICQSRFIISDDAQYAFCTWNRRGKWYLAKISLDDLSCHIYPYKASMFGIADLFFQEHNKLLVLETQNISIEGKTVSQSQITSVEISEGRCLTTPMCQWNGKGSSNYFDGRYVWESGYWIRDIATGEYYNLLEKTDISLPEKHVPLSHVYYPEHKLLQLVDDKQNMFIDCEQKKLIARYPNDTQKLSFQGIYTGNEFWLGKPDGIYAMPFPMIAEV